MHVHTHAFVDSMEHATIESLQTDVFVCRIHKDENIRK